MFRLNKSDAPMSTHTQSTAETRRESSDNWRVNQAEAIKRHGSDWIKAEFSFVHDKQPKEWEC